MTTNKTVMLITFYNSVPIGVHCLETALLKQGYNVRTIFFKSFKSFYNSKYKEATDKELSLLKDNIEKYKPALVGVSVPCSVYLKTTNKVINMIKDNFSIPVFAGGVFATLCPDYFLDNKTDFVIRSDGEKAVTMLADAITNKTPYENIPSLCFKKDEQNIFNDIEVENDLDNYGIPIVISKNACFIDKNKQKEGDPGVNNNRYETITSRGCPFSCTYCCGSKLRKYLPKGTKAIRMRSVHNVIEELKECKRLYKHLFFVQFQDEVFPTDSKWIDEFTTEYKKHINIPFKIWANPKTIDYPTMKKLVSAGLTEVNMGIQSGSEHIRRDIFHRYDTNEDIINATKIMHDTGVHKVYLDFILQHPFENIEDLKQTYWLVKNLFGNFVLFLRHLSYFPETDIIDMVVNEGFYTREQMNEMLFSPDIRPYEPNKKIDVSDESNAWFQMIFLLQYKELRKKVKTFEKNPLKYKKQIEQLYNIARKAERFRNLYTNIKLSLKKFKL